MAIWFGSYAANTTLHPYFYGPFVQDPTAVTTTDILFPPSRLLMDRIDFDEVVVISYGMANVWISAVFFFQIQKALRKTWQEQNLDHHPSPAAPTQHESLSKTQQIQQQQNQQQQQQTQTQQHNQQQQQQTQTQTQKRRSNANNHECRNHTIRQPALTLV